MIRIGYGYDSHRLVAGNGIVLGGIKIPFEYAFQAHSDGDVVLHALIDALFGAMGCGDIGEHFPSTKAAYKDISSMILLQKAYEKLIKCRYHINNIDMTVIAEKPSLVQYKLQMKKNIAHALNMSETDISIKAKTNEGMGYLGRGEGILAHCVVLIEKEK